MTHLLFVAFLLLSSITFAESETPAEKQDPFQKIINEHYLSYSKMENFSAIQVTIKTADEIHTYVKGTKALTPGSMPITNKELFNIGSITKSFTAALAVMAEAEDKLQLQQTLNQYLQNYPHWGEITLTRLLNMSSGIPNYSDSPKINYLMSKNLKQFWNPVELIDLVYPRQFNPPRKKGYFYSNSGYVLMDMILSSQYKKMFRSLLEEKIISFLKLENTYYPIPNFSTDVLLRMVRGYSYNIYENPELLGQDVTENNLSWAGAAGAIVANSEAVAQWVEHLFIRDTLLTKEQKRKMQQLISVKTGQPISETDADDPRGFGLGIIQGYQPNIGHYWYYEGETLGYRALYLYSPCNHVIVVALFNSATNNENDHAGDLIQALYQQLLKMNTHLICNPSST
ncbi:serine hydrolase domain-containing protein [Legionella israelensis]|uniref:(Serine-type) D-alanyl-D-alanine carboxypeptidase n=1 Tax=Legionella israelensis TaxID=454 RepID=A0A0W0VQP7_9GAMM|nr:serine hydrolase domain-containing protein [Legionella israelensis]KTD22482.1 (serine-type) D-alanyl-D-alanine carboxypeptidase [Legionella israelensis]QBS09557.1 class A beta-lactamase-related serine hydrolase [Legionella israelensis]SCY17209.1 D-alanyl-D-alanine carboxypeptidase [Legionella israelensis DSM 19235]STX60477.1 (serine-type) D-alanyl-D-alanine carboxypeptidase [Legionella israelensis]